MKSRLFVLLLIPYFSFSQNFSRAVDSIRLSRTIPGMVYAVFSADRIIETGSCGYRKYRTRDTLRLNDRFDIGTNTGTFTAYIAGRLVEKNRIKWSTKLLDIFPEFRSKAFAVYKDITLQQLLSNKAGAPLFSTVEDWFRTPIVQGSLVEQRKAFTLYMLQQKPYAGNQTTDKVKYSIAGYVMAAAMLEKVAGLPWERLVSDYISNPLKISIQYAWPNLADSTANTGHWNQNGVFRAEGKDTWLRLNPVFYPAQDININIADYVKFVQENMRGLLGKKAQMNKTEFDMIHFGLPDYSLGWNNGSIDNNSYSFAEGISVLFNCRAEIIKEKNIGIIVMCNSGDNDGRAGVLNVSQMLEAYYLNR